jgi:PAT family beta-lactamase induction signal transducer AmpG
LKLFAGPFMDRFAFPAMGRRRPWVMSAQFGLTLSMASLALVTDAVAQIALLTVIAFAVNLFAAVQDVAVDGMAIDVLPPSERGRANALMAFGQVAGYSSFAALSGVLLNAGGLPTAALVGTVAIGAVLLLITLTREGASGCCLDAGAATTREYLPRRRLRGSSARTRAVSADEHSAGAGELLVRTAMVSRSASFRCSPCRA